MRPPKFCRDLGAIQRETVEGEMPRARATERQPPSKSTTDRAGCMECLMRFAILKIAKKCERSVSALDPLLMQAQHVALSACNIVTINQEWFQERLRQLKISQRQLAKRIGVDPANLKTEVLRVCPYKIVVRFPQYGV